MKINKNSWHYKIWKTTFDYVVPENTDLCRYCHRVFWRLFLYSVAAVCLVAMIGWLGYLLFYLGLYQHTLVTLGVVAVISAIFGAIYCYTRWLDDRKVDQEPKTLIGKYIAASKRKVCPLVNFEE